MSLIETAHERTLQAANAMLFISLLLALVVFRWSVELFAVAVGLTAAVHLSRWVQQATPSPAIAREAAGHSPLR